MLIQALPQQFQSYFDSADSHTVVLWFDPEREYEALLPHLAAVTLWRYDGSLLRLRYRLRGRAAGEKTVVYLPMRPEDAEVLRPFFATSLPFTDRFYKFLRRQGLDFPDDSQVAHELRALLPRLAARSVSKGREFWTYNLANLERARETLIGSFDDALLRFLAGPATESLIGALEERTLCCQHPAFVYKRRLFCLILHDRLFACLAHLVTIPMPFPRPNYTP